MLVDNQFVYERVLMWKRAHNYWLEHIQPKLIRLLLFITRGEILYIFLALVITIVIIVWAIRSKRDVNNVVELSTFSAVVLEGGLVALVGLFRSLIQNYTEDPKKLTDNYNELVKRYSSEPNLVWKRNGDNDLSLLPVIHVAWLQDKEIITDDHPESEYLLPEIIDKHYEELFNTHLTSKIFNNTNIRVDDWYLDDSTRMFYMITGRTSYYNSLVTNRTMDYELKNGISVRELLECGPMVHPLKYSSLSNHLGFNGFVESDDHKIMLVKRKRNVSIGKRTWGNSVGASLKTKYALNDEFRFNNEGLWNGIVREIEDELGIPAITLVHDNNTKDHIMPVTLVAAYRDMLEGGKPQLLFYAKTTMTSEEISVSFERINEELTKTRTNFNRANSELEMKTDGDELYWMDIKDIRDCKIYPDRIVHNDLVLKMVPSAAACVAMFAQYLKMRKEPKTLYSMPVHECYLHGKNGDDDSCEDGVYCGKRFVAIVDGDTSDGTKRYKGKTSGRCARDIIISKFAQLDYAKLNDTRTPKQVLEALDKAMGAFMGGTANVTPETRLRASVVYYDRLHEIVVSYGDCKFKVVDIISDSTKSTDTFLSDKRAEVISKALDSGKTVAELRENDPGRMAIIDDLKQQHIYENNLNCALGYPVLCGCGINDSMITIHPVYEGDNVILCSDGYPQVCDTLEESEEKLQQLLQEDPLLIGMNTDSFDDRAWVKVGWS